MLLISLFVWSWFVVNDRKFSAGTVFFSYTNQPAVLLHEPATIWNRLFVIVRLLVNVVSSAPCCSVDATWGYQGIRLVHRDVVDCQYLSPWNSKDFMMRMPRGYLAFHQDTEILNPHIFLFFLWYISFTENFLSKLSKCTFCNHRDIVR